MQLTGPEFSFPRREVKPAGPKEEHTTAIKLADETVALYGKAANYIYENLDNKSGNMKGDGRMNEPISQA